MKIGCVFLQYGYGIKSRGYSFEYKGFYQILKQINKEFAVTIIIVTHNKGIASLADKVIYLRDGTIYGTSSYDPLKEKAFWEDLNSPSAIKEI